MNNKRNKQIITLYRVGNKNRHIKIIYKICEEIIYHKFNCIISVFADIGNNPFFPHPLGIVIGEGTRIGDNCTIYQNVTIGRKDKSDSRYPVIGNNVTIYCNSSIVGNVKIGHNAIIGCNSVVLRDVKEGETVYGIVK